MSLGKHPYKYPEFLDKPGYRSLISESASRDLLRSAFERPNSAAPIDYWSHWLTDRTHETQFSVHQIPLSNLQNWHFDAHFNLVHDSGKFFSIRGLSVQTNWAKVTKWQQPIIAQPEVGILGILCQKRNGVLHFLLQAKMEPGNINRFQLSPTVQATKSNYTQVHGGKTPPYLDEFLHLSDKKIIVDQLHSEQGARFYKKRNRNLIIEVDPGYEVPQVDNYCWLTLWEIKRLLESDNLVNMNTRSVLSCTQLDDMHGRSEQLVSVPDQLATYEHDVLMSLLAREATLFSIEEIISWFTGLKTICELDVTLTGIDELNQWRVNDLTISHTDNKYFEVIGIRAEIGRREVQTWCQPMIRQHESGIAGFIVKKINDVYHLLVQAKLEVGNFDILEMAPTVQCITGSYTNPEYKVPYLDYFSEARGLILYDKMQSEEGGRFYQEQNRYMLLEVDDTFPLDVEPAYIWMTFGQVKTFIKFNNYFNVEARSLIACITPI